VILFIDKNSRVGTIENLLPTVPVNGDHDDVFSLIFLPVTAKMDHEQSQNE
jgi:hypothetical protein